MNPAPTWTAVGWAVALIVLVLAIVFMANNHHENDTRTHIAGVAVSRLLSRF